MKKISILLLSLFFISTMDVYSEEIPNNEIWYTSSDGEVVIPTSGTYWGGAKMLSNTYSEGKGVIVFDRNLIEISYQAFLGCCNLTEITLPNSLEIIGRSAFASCTNLATINMSNNILEVDSRAFYNTAWLNNHLSGPLYIGKCFIGFKSYSSTNYTIKDGTRAIAEEALINNTSLNYVTIPNSVITIGASAFEGCTNLKTVYMRENGDCSKIQTHAFKGCTSLSSFSFPRQVSTVSSGVLEDCSNLVFVGMYNGISSIYNSAFQSCTNLTTVTIPNTVEEIKSSAFWGCSKLKHIYLESSIPPVLDGYPFISDYVTFHIPVSSMNAYTTNDKWKDLGTFVNNVSDPVSALGDAFKFRGIYYIITDAVKKQLGVRYEHYDSENGYGYSDYYGNIVIPETIRYNNVVYTVSSIGESAFYDEYASGNLKSIELPNTINSIGNEAFYNCSQLTSITIPNSVTSIGSRAFGGCSSLASITIGNSLTSIKDYVFVMCSSLTSITIPNSVKSIGNYAFDRCSNLATISIGDSVSSIGRGAFQGCSSLASITIPNSVTNIEDRAFHACSSLTSITIPKSVTSIGESVLGACSNLTSITVDADNPVYDSRDNCNAIIVTSSNTLLAGCKSTTFPNSVPNIGEYAFSSCSGLTSITIPSSVKSIGDYTFDDCSNLATISIGDSVSSIGRGAFYQCSSLTSIIIPNSVTSIGEYAFKYCSSLSSVTIPNSVMSIGDAAFYDCSSLANFYCHAEQIPSTGSYVFSSVPLTNATLYVPKNSVSLYRNTYPWNGFGTITSLSNVFVTNLEEDTFETKIKSNDSFTLADNIKSIEITETIPSVNLTYTRNFTDDMVNNWQAWYMPCDFDYDDLSEDFDVAEIAGVLFDKDGQNYVAFRKMTEGTVKAHTPYVVRAKAAGDVAITTTTTLQPTSGSKSFSMQSAYNNFTFGGVYENSYLSTEQPTYALNKSGNFAVMASDVYLRPFRIYMRITDREDNPYAAVTAPQEVKVVVLGEDETSIDEIHNAQFIIHNDESSEIYNLAGQKLQKLQKGINIVNGRKVLF